MAAGVENIDAQVLRSDLDFKFVRLGQHRHRGGGGVDATLGFRIRNPLHPMDPPLVLQMAEGAFPLNFEDYLIEAAQVRGVGVHNLHLPAL